MRTLLATIGAIYLAAWVLASLGYADMQVCFAWKGSCSAASSPSQPPRRNTV